jgi:hypothetical protein
MIRILIKCSRKKVFHGLQLNSKQKKSHISCYQIVVSYVVLGKKFYIVKKLLSSGSQYSMLIVLPLPIFCSLNKNRFLHHIVQGWKMNEIWPIFHQNSLRNLFNLLRMIRKYHNLPEFLGHQWILITSMLYFRLRPLYCGFFVSEIVFCCTTCFFISPFCGNSQIHHFFYIFLGASLTRLTRPSLMVSNMSIHCSCQLRTRCRCTVQAEDHKMSSTITTTRICILFLKAQHYYYYYYSINCNYQNKIMKYILI